MYPRIWANVVDVEAKHMWRSWHELARLLLTAVLLLWELVSSKSIPSFEFSGALQKRDLGLCAGSNTFLWCEVASNSSKKTENNKHNWVSWEQVVPIVAHDWLVAAMVRYYRDTVPWGPTPHSLLYLQKMWWCVYMVVMVVVMVVVSQHVQKQSTNLG